MTPALMGAPVSPTRVKPDSGGADVSLKGGTNLCKQCCLTQFSYHDAFELVFYLSISGALDARADSAAAGRGGTGEMGRDSSAVTCSFIELKLGSIVSG